MEQSISKFRQFEELSLSKESIQFLKEVAKWSFFLSIIGFIMIGLMLIIGLFFTLVFNNLPEEFNPYASLGIGNSFFIVFYLIMAVIGFFPTFYLLNFSRKMKTAIKSNDSEILTRSLSNLKAYFKFIGVLTIIVIGIYFLAFIIGLFARASASAF